MNNKVSELLYIGLSSKIYNNITSGTYSSRIGLSEKDGKYCQGSNSQLVGSIDPVELAELIGKISESDGIESLDYKYVKVSIKYPFLDDDINIIITNLYRLIKGYLKSSDIELSPYIVVKQTKSDNLYKVYTYVTIFIPALNVKDGEIKPINIYDNIGSDSLDRLIKVSIYESIEDDCKSFNYKLAESLHNLYLKNRDAIYNNARNRITKIEYADTIEM